MQAEAEHAAIRMNADAAVLRALNKPVTVNADQTPLDQLAGSLSEQLGVPFRMDVARLADRGVNSDEPITWRSSGLTARQTLAAMFESGTLSSKELIFLAVRGEVLITTSGVEYDHQTARIFDVSALLPQREKPFDADSRRVPNNFYDFNSLVPLVQHHVAGPWRCTDAECGTIDRVVVGDRPLLIVNHVPRVHREVAALLSALDGGQGNSGDDPVAALNREFASTVAAREAELLTQLHRPADIHVKDVPLYELLSKIGRDTGLMIRVDHKALEKARIPSDEPITYRSALGTPLSASLGAMLGEGELGLTWIIHHGDVFITTIYTASKQIRPRIYDVSALAPRLDQPRPFVKAEPPRPSAAPAGEGFFQFVMPPGHKSSGEKARDKTSTDFSDESAPATHFYDFDPLLSLILSQTTGPWTRRDGFGGLMTPFVRDGRPLLVISQTAAIHREIASLLDRLTRIANAASTNN